MEKFKVSLVSLGCAKNLVDAEVMLGHLPLDRYEIVLDDSQADIIIVNTCSFINDAKEESVDTILEVADFKQEGHCKLLVVTGCLPQRYKEDLAKQLPEVDLFIGIGEVPRLVELIERQLQQGKPSVEVGEPDFLYDHQTPRVNSSPFYSSYIKIAEGCSNYCSYCIIPQLRGGLRSRAIDSVVKEARNLAAQGVKEINLIAQDITAYGMDRADGATIETLLKELVKVEEIDWIRLLYAYPEGVSDELIDLIATEDKICNYLDIPLQHIDDQVLAAMNRRLGEEGIRALLKKLRERIPDLTLRTSFIVGFPGETREQYDKLLEFVKEGHFERVGVFRYSREEGTGAAELPDQVPGQTKRGRLNRLMKAQARVSFNKNRALIGRTETVLVEGYSDETDLLLKGRSARQAPDVDGQFLITSGQADVGELVQLKITDSSEYDLIGEIIEE
ncbi:SSU ribosomal protein S12P methylthiotransferase [Malonomonas rubra DSM 5091]|uniref:Ribosomal protein uS12 methylthiotransferase RimO n=1 Tax=Malonomonas rubra DSM 5091 TaxID=1122189 RepID=A0A1M6JY94_MALRU|nr:30S ribosomal protein S12 methylthiotransferase RimO [Malonomonas rubra]SHJ51656.1 SSU ribosomal protein S12P methylthiotransferase [Malonomonas rubra DSM 5091]